MSGYIGTQPVPQATQHRETFTATSSQTTFATAGYTPQFLDVFLNGIHLLNPEDYTASNGSDVVLTAGAALDDVLEVISYSPFEVADQTFTGDTSTDNLSVTGAFTSKGIDDNATSTAMTLDASGNLLVGKTSAGAATGVELFASGQVAVTRDGAVPAFFRRNTSDGSLIDFNKDGTTVGSIAAGAGGFLTIGSPNGTPVYATFANGSLKPTNSAGSNSDGSGDLGNTSSRWKDLYLSGGVYLGGTGAANLLDDYEEGTWTPVLVGASGTPSYTLLNSTGYYVRIGNLVHVTMDWYANNISGGAGDYYFTGLPFARDMNLPGSTGPARFYQVGGYNPAVAIYGGTALAPFVSTGVTNSTWRWGVVGDITGTSIVAASISYQAV